MANISVLFTFLDYQYYNSGNLIAISNTWFYSYIQLWRILAYYLRQESHVFIYLIIWLPSFVQ